MGKSVMDRARDAERKEQEGVYFGVLALGLFHEERCESGMELTGLKLRPPRSRGDDWMVVVTANRMGVAQVLYESGTKPELLLLKVFKLLDTGEGNWKDDKFKKNE